MKICKEHNFGKIAGYELGLGYIGAPVMTVYCYLMDDILIDTGPANMRRDFLSIIDNEKIHYGVLTHHHEDHSGNAEAFINKKNVPLYGHPLTASKMRKGFNVLPYQHYMFGRADAAVVLPFPEKIRGNKYALIPVHTPGHSKDHTVYFEEKEGWLFSGDLYLGSRIKYFRSDENYYRMMESLKKVLSLDFDSLFCSVNPQATGGKDAIRRKLNFMEDLLGYINKLQQQGVTDKEIFRQAKRKESKLLKIFTLGNVSYSNMIKSILNDNSNF